MTVITYRSLDSVSQAPELMAYGDLLTQMVDFSGAMIGEVNERNWKNAIAMAMRRVSKIKTWKYFVSNLTIKTVGDTDLTASYDHTGGAYERLVTATVGTLPAAADLPYYYVIIDSKYYEVDEWKSATTFTLTNSANPGADVASGSMKLVRSLYPLPADFLKETTITTDIGVPLSPVSPEELDWLAKGIRGVGTPNAYAIVGVRRFYGHHFLKIVPRGDGNVISMTYRRYSRGLKHTGFGSDSTGTFTSGGTDSKEYATLSSANEAASMLGALIRVRSDTNTPEGATGKYPFTEQRVVVMVDTTNHRLYFDRPLDSTYTAKAYCVVDPIDVAPHMIDAVIAACRVEFAKQQPKEWREKAALDAEYNQALREALEGDKTYDGAGYREPIYIDRMHIQYD